MNIKHIVPNFFEKRYCLNGRYGKPCKRTVNTGFCWQHYPKIIIYDSHKHFQECTLKLMDIYRLATNRNDKIKLSQVFFEVVSINKWYLHKNTDFYQKILNKYHASKVLCKLERYSYLEETPLSNSDWADCYHYWLFPHSRRKYSPNSCYSF